MAALDGAVWAVARELGRIAKALERRNDLELREVHALERRNTVELLGVWSSYRMAGGGAGDQDLIRLAVELDNTLTKEISRGS